MKRLENESFEDYKQRRKLESELTEMTLKTPKRWWPSSKRGTYMKPEKQQQKNKEKKTMTKKKEENMVTYLITHEDRTERKITVPSNWKVTFGPATRGSNRYNHGTSTPKMPMALRFYENENRQRAIFTDVVSFRDLSIKTEIKKVKVQEKQGFMECEGQKKATVFRATVEEWADPDKTVNTPALPMSKNVNDFDVEFNNEE